jgi:hypothetical protein
MNATKVSLLRTAGVVEVVAPAPAMNSIVYSPSCAKLPVNS